MVREIVKALVSAVFNNQTKKQIDANHMLTESENSVEERREMAAPRRQPC